MAEPDPEALGEVAAQDRLLPPPDARPDPRFYQWAGVSHLFDPATYQDLPPPSIAPNEQGKVPQSDPRVLGGLADLTNVAQNVMPIGGSAVGAAKAAVPLLGGLARGAVREAPAAERAVAQGIRAYHSSPHDFDRFDLSKIGTGEGAQVYGHGLYFAENPAVSGQGGQYWKQFLGKFMGTPEGEAARELMQSGFDRQKAIGYLERDLNSKRELGLDPMDPSFAQTRVALERLRSGQPVGPRTYEVNINARPEEMLDYDRSLSEQSDHVKSTLGGLGIEDTGGQSLINYLAEKFGGSSRSSKSLRDVGIPGIRYLDQWSRGAGNGTNNYVIFDPSRIDILRKYGMVGGAVPAAGGAMGELARQEQ